MRPTPFRCLLGAFAMFAAASAAVAAEPKWLRLQAADFGIVSQLGEKDTRRWAVEFDQFIGALHALYDVEEGSLPPLTIVLFRQAKDFAPYRLVTVSGQTQVDGFFARAEDWSVIGLSGGGHDAATRALIYHEAVHWFASASSMPAPLWFSEGIAEVLSSFRAVDGKGRWGEAIEHNIGYLQYAGLLPMEDLLRASQDEALHGRDSSRYYPQAWAFVHYLMFGNGGAQQAKLFEFLRLQRQTDLDTAFATAFGKSYDEFTDELRRYVRNGRYHYAVVPLRDRGAEMTVAQASELNVEAAQARLAIMSGNGELSLAHAARVVALAPESPVGYELTALAAEHAEDNAAVETAIDRAIALGSREAFVYRAKADRLIAANQSETGFLDDLLPADVARSAADLYRRALGPQPRDTAALRGLAISLLNVAEPTEADALAVSAARITSPTSGLALVSQAAIDKSRGEIRAATDLLRQATAEPYTLPVGLRVHVTALRNYWLGGALLAELNALIGAAEFADANAFLTTQLADETITGSLRTRLENARKELPELERLYAAAQAHDAGNARDAIEILSALVDDPDTSDRTRRTAERMLRNSRTMGTMPTLEN